jgi:hypothetical protein
MEIMQALEMIAQHCIAHPKCEGCVVDKEDDLDEHMCMLAMRPSLWKLDKIKSAMPSTNNRQHAIITCGNCGQPINSVRA